MKNKVSIKSFLSVLLFLCFIACRSDNKEKDILPPKPEEVPKVVVENPILGVEVQHHKDYKVVIDDKEKSINIDFSVPTGLKKLALNFSLAPKIRLIDRDIKSYDLSSAYSLKIKNGSEEQEYKINAKATNGDLANWTITSDFSELPDHIKIYKASQLQERDVIAYAAIIDMATPVAFNVLGEAEGVKTLANFYNDEIADKKPIILINAGYFNMTTGISTSLVIKDGITLDNNTTTLTKEKMTYYPTRSAIGINKDGTMEVNWVYTENVKGSTYAYPTIAPNKVGQTPLAKPYIGFPQDGYIWRPQAAVGAGPILAKYGILADNMDSEMLDGGGLGFRPRAAIGLTSDNKLVLFVCEGDNATPGISGMTWNEVGLEMIKLGCYDALNLDGGGSVSMLINGVGTIKHINRRISTAIGIY